MRSGGSPAARRQIPTGRRRLRFRCDSPGCYGSSAAHRPFRTGRSGYSGNWENGHRCRSGKWRPAAFCNCPRRSLAAGRHAAGSACRSIPYPARSNVLRCCTGRGRIRFCSPSASPACPSRPAPRCFSSSISSPAGAGLFALRSWPRDWPKQGSAALRPASAAPPPPAASPKSQGQRSAQNAPAFEDEARLRRTDRTHRTSTAAPAVRSGSPACAG